MKKAASGYAKYASIYFFYFFAMGIFSSMLSVYLGGTGKSASEISLIVSASGIFTMIIQPLIAMLYDRTGEQKRISIFLLLFSAVSAILFSITRSTALLFLLNGVTMALLNSVNPVCEQIASNCPFRYGIVRLWGAVGYAVACQVSGLVLEHSSASLNFVLFAIAAVLTILSFFAVGTIPAMQKQAGAKKESHTLSKLLMDRKYLSFLVICFLFSGATSAGGTYVPVLLNEMLGDTSVVGTILFLGTLMEIPLIFLSNRFMDKLSGKQLLLINAALVIIQYLIYSCVHSVTVICAVLFLTKSVSTMLFIMVTLKVVLDLTDGNYATTALAIAGTCKSIGGVVIVWLAGIAIDTYGLRMAFALLAVVACLAFVIAAVTRFPYQYSKYFSEDSN